MASERLGRSLYTGMALCAYVRLRHSGSNMVAEQWHDLHERLQDGDDEATEQRLRDEGALLSAGDFERRSKSTTSRTSTKETGQVSLTCGMQRAIYTPGEVAESRSIG